ncbi:MAG TPA: hypothetical protein VK203_13190 [Nostocaceae cyanobacterium]|nr:hypothetical protein [Nostocaceae cyanobacterium]
MLWKLINNYLGAGVAFLAFIYPQTTRADILPMNPEPVEINRLSTPQKLTIPPIKQSEITIGLSDNDSNNVARTESVSSRNDLLRPPVLNNTITREFPNLWLMRVPLEDVPLLYATYEIKAENGRAEAVSNEQNANFTAPVVLEPLPITVISQDPNTNTAVVQGGVLLKINLSVAQAAGEYTGDLTVTVDRR